MRLITWRAPEAWYDGGRTFSQKYVCCECWWLVFNLIYPKSSKIAIWCFRVYRPRVCSSQMTRVLRWRWTITVLGFLNVGAQDISHKLIWTRTQLTATEDENPMAWVHDENHENKLTNFWRFWVKEPRQSGTISLNEKFYLYRSTRENHHTFTQKQFLGEVFGRVYKTPTLKRKRTASAPPPPWHAPPILTQDLTGAARMGNPTNDPVGSTRHQGNATKECNMQPIRWQNNNTLASICGVMEARHSECHTSKTVCPLS